MLLEPDQILTEAVVETVIQVSSLLKINKMNNNSKVLALKYRPQTFDDLIGQEVVAENYYKFYQSRQNSQCLSVHWNKRNWQNYNC